jgi:uncharacterized membrane protein YeaQ/YmgE (transglycosylase-associated protein family)
MSTEMITLLVVGLLAGWAAGFVIKAGGFGVAGDFGLGLGGSILAAILGQAVGIGVEAGWLATALVALIGATVVIGAQRRFWSRPRSQRAA